MIFELFFSISQQFFPRTVLMPIAYKNIDIFKCFTRTQSNAKSWIFCKLYRIFQVVPQHFIHAAQHRAAT